MGEFFPLLILCTRMLWSSAYILAKILMMENAFGIQSRHEDIDHSDHKFKMVAQRVIKN